MSVVTCGYHLQGCVESSGGSGALFFCFFVFLFFCFLFGFSTGLVRLYITGLPLRSCPDPWATFCAGGPPMSDFRFWQ